MGRCQHVYTEPGPQVPALYGSWETEVCTRCGMYRVNHHYWGRWLKGPVPADTTSNEGEPCQHGKIPPCCGFRPEGQ